MNNINIRTGIPRCDSLSPTGAQKVVQQFIQLLEASGKASRITYMPWGLKISLAGWWVRHLTWDSNISFEEDVLLGQLHTELMSMLESKKMYESDGVEYKLAQMIVLAKVRYWVFEDNDSAGMEKFINGISKPLAVFP